MKSEIFLPIVTFPNPCSEKFATNAVEVARYLDSDLHAFILNVDIPKITNAFGDLLLKLPTLIVEAEEASRTRGRELLTTIAKEGAAAGITIGNTSNSVHPDNFGQLAAAQARYYDLSIAGWGLDDASGQLTTESLIFESGRPVLLLPEMSILNGFDEIMVAWDGGRVAARALADARPFLMRAKTIEVVSVTDEKPLPYKDIAQKLATALTRRGLKAEAVCINAESRPIGEALEAHALKTGTQLLVMGGYGHSRIRDFVLGGATQHFIRNLRLPVMMAH